MHNLICYGRHSGTEPGWMMFEQDGQEWEEQASDWQEVIVLTHGYSYYQHKTDGRKAVSA